MISADRADRETNNHLKRCAALNQPAELSNSQRPSNVLCKAAAPFDFLARWFDDAHSTACARSRQSTPPSICATRIGGRCSPWMPRWREMGSYT
ncbi:hypothetical protein K491DRAFT_686605 [Lophiostoma macrostomum CBS 122681]|uniref:Uncharacterized protein n=1 Tax=Lophiostoma macrostomum CBS 122681 TaxID=1314788 RepID=A0A6A6TRQ6_9PLEO|nr:hypothetical protein K491DRAFT_686605 [Lophiostoma macrostomum CBS 122681]